MKISVEIDDELLLAAGRFATREGVSMDALLERGLRTVLIGRSESAPFRLRDASFTGEGLQPGVATSGGQRLLELASLLSKTPK